MTAPYLSSSRHSDHDRSSHAARTHQHQSMMRGLPPTGWTNRKLIRLSLVITAGLIAVAGALAIGLEPVLAWSEDVSRPNGAVGAYFRAAEEGRDADASALLCASERGTLISQGFFSVTTVTIRENPMEPYPVLIGGIEKRDAEYVVEVTNGEANTGWIRVVWEADGQAYRVCGFA
jgi:hypothetical protein